jgi:transcriptional regulator with PAS, ATPase and Fis domain
MDCAVLQGSLLESELFGHQKGAFTGATGAKAGLVEVADGGTLFVDEIGEMPLELQSKLLRVLEHGEYRRVGSVQDEKVDIRVIAATNRDLAAEVKKRRFRADLYYRLNVLSIVLPPLGERIEDIPLLTRHFLENSRVAFTGKKRLTADTLRCLEAYEWPGNIRELANVVERAIILSGTQAALRPEHLPPDIRNARRHPAQRLQGRSLEEAEKEAIAAALAASGGHKTRTAAILGIARITLREKMAKYGL